MLEAQAGSAPVRPADARDRPAHERPHDRSQPLRLGQRVVVEERDDVAGRCGWRGGGNGAVAADGATYREIMDVADWDRSVATNVPGQSGQPESAFYGNLLPLWDRAEYFPLLYTRSRIDRDAAHRLTLRPQ